MIPVTMIMAITADGKIAKDKTQFANWTSKADKQLFIQTSREFGMIMMGENTFNTFPSPLKDRLNVVFTEKTDKPEIAGVKWVSGEPADVLTELEKLGYKKALLGGGSFMNSLFLKNNLIDEIILTVEPKIFGAGLSLFNTDFDVNLELLVAEKIGGNSVMLKYKVLK